MIKQILFIIIAAVVFSGNLALAETAQVKIISPSGGAVGWVGVAQEIKWSTTSYPREAGVNINLLRKISSNPDKYELVKVIKENTKNDGMETWTPEISDKGDNLVIQVSCSGNFIFPEGCVSSGGFSKIAVMDYSNRGSYIANAIKSINDSIIKIIEKIKFLKNK